MHSYKFHIILLALLVSVNGFAQNANSASDKEIREISLLKEIQKNDKQILPLLFHNSNVSFADSLIKLTARTQPEQLYIFAQAINTPLGKRIHACNDPVVNVIAELSKLDEGRLYFPFIDDLVAGKITRPEISKTFGKENKTNYYKLLVKTQTGYAERLKKNDTLIAAASLMNMLKLQAVHEYINVINELHEYADPVRLKVLTTLNAEELYYLCISGENELYTSSYLKIYKLIFKDLKLKDGYSLLQKVNFDHYKRFIKMASNFNTLDDFLQRMHKENADSLMRSFVSGMEGPNGLEDAVDVADSYASLPGIRLRSLILEEVQKNLNKLSQTNNKIGSTIYGLLNTIFLSMDNPNKTDLSAALGIPPVYQLNNSALQDSTGKIIIQQFFYGDKDGQYEFSIFIKNYRNANWKTIWKKDWVELHSVKGKRVVIYSNRPLDEENFSDLKAQEALGKYLEQNKLPPTIVIHRGHSYYIKPTIRQLAPTAKLVLLGSCGGYNNLSQVIKTCPYVHIIATKQEGTGRINQPMIIYLTELLRQGKNFNWPLIWKSFTEIFKGNKRFDDYIPPHQNLGAIFIMAYNKAMGL